MPKATLTFTLPEEAEKFRNAIDAEEMASILRAIDNVCNRVLDDAVSDDVAADYLRQIRGMIPHEVTYPCDR